MEETTVTEATVKEKTKKAVKTTTNFETALKAIAEFSTLGITSGDAVNRIKNIAKQALKKGE